MKKNLIYYLTLFACINVFLIQSCAREKQKCEQTFYQDADGDGYGNPNSIQKSCEKPAGFSPLNTDFNDNDATAYPGAPEICNDGVDNDGDSFIDCEDNDCLNSTLKECNCSDGKDNDSDGFTDCDDMDCTGRPGC